MLLGRTVEKAAISALLADACGGKSRTLVLTGEPGIGKSTLLLHAIASAAGMQVTRVAGAELEQELDFAGLHSLLVPFLDRREQLPRPQREALGAAFGMNDVGPADRFLVGLAAMTLIADVANAQPLLCVVDDVQWIDEESIAVLAFITRRLHADKVAFVCAIREPIVGPDPLDGFERLPVGGLDEADATALLERSSQAPLSPKVTKRVLDETQGHPLAIEELGRDLSVEQASGAEPLPPSLPIGERLEASYLQRVRDLPVDTQTLVLVAAAEASSDPDAVRRAADALDIRPDAFDEAAAAGLVTVGERVEFRHPLVRSAVYGGALPADRRRIHLALANATDPEQNPERRALHRAAASPHADEDVAAELERCSLRARARGGYAAEASLLTRAADLSPDPLTRTTRLLSACRAVAFEGNPARAKSLIALAVPGLRTEEQRATARLMEGRIQGLLGRCSRGPVMLLDAAQAFVPLDRNLARDSFLAALDMYLMTHFFTEGTTGVEIARAALAFLETEGSLTSAENILLDAVARLVASGDADAFASLERVAACIREGSISADEFVKWPNYAPMIGNELFDYDVFRIAANRGESLGRARGALEALDTALLSNATVETRSGRFDRAHERHAEVLDLVGVLGRGGYYELLDVEEQAWRGNDATVRAKALMLQEQGTAIGVSATVCMAWLAIAVLELGQAHHREAFDAAHRVWASDAAGFSCMALPYVVEAGVRCGEDAAASEALAALEERALAGGSPSALGHLARASALLASDDDAEPGYRTAIELFGSTDWVTELARSHLTYGEWLRRRLRRSDAREHLRIAYGMFADMGAAGFAERARIELAGTGEHARKRTFETAFVLTPQESQVARLAAARATNREIAAQLFISSNTVDYHLRKIYRKLGIGSRRDLATAMKSERTENVPPS